MNDPKELHQELIAQHDDGAEQGVDSPVEEEQGVLPEAPVAHQEEVEVDPFAKLIGTLGDHREIEFGPWHVLDLPVILVDDGLHFYRGLEQMEEEGHFHYDHEAHGIVSHATGQPPALDLSVTSLVAFQWLGMVLLLAAFVPMARKYRKLGPRPPKGFFNALESLVVYVRDEIVIPNVGTSPLARSLTPIFLTFFFFILLLNFMGLIPGGHSATGSLSVTAGLAIVAFVVIQFAAIRKNGLGAWLKHLTGGVHWSLWPIMVPVEILGLFTKPFALCVRLFANMTGGHIVLLSLVGLAFIGTAFIPVTIGFSLFINLLEILIAFIQAYIFTILTAVFTGMGMESHEHEHEETHALEH